MTNDLLHNIVQVWFRQLKAAEAAKEDRFGKTASRIWRQFGASWAELYGQTAGDEFAEFQFAGADNEVFQPRISLTGKYVQTMLPYVLSRVPNRMVAPRRPAIPPEILQLITQAQVMAQQAAVVGQPFQASPFLQLLAAAAPMQDALRLEDTVRAWLIQWWLNYLPDIYGLQEETALACIEALAKGRGVVWHELTDGPSGDVPGAFYDSVDNLFIDATAVQFRTANFIYRKREQSTWEVAERFGLDPDLLRSSAKRKGSHPETEEGELETVEVDEHGHTVARDTIQYYEVWSRIGLGQRFESPGDALELLANAEETNPHCYLALMRGLPYPLNLPPDLLGPSIPQSAIEKAIKWDFPTYENTENPWPCTPLDFIPATDDAWATSPLQAALPLQVFIDHLWAFLLEGTARRCKQLVVVANEVKASLKDAIAEGGDMQIVELPGKSIQKLDEVLHVVKFESMSKDLYQLVPLCNEAFEEMTGISPLLTKGGVGATQPRSAEEMAVREHRASSRPDDYADTVERFHSAIARTSAAISRLQVSPLTVAPLFGEQPPEPGENEDPEDANWWTAKLGECGPLTQLWASLVTTPDGAKAFSELNYTVEHGTGRRKNRQKIAQDMQTVGQLLLPPAIERANLGDPTQYNTFVEMVATALENDGVLKMRLPPGQPMVQEPTEGEPEEGGPPSDAREGE